MRIWVTGDTHGNFSNLIAFIQHWELGPDDLVIILGDAGFNYFGDELGDKKRKKLVNRYNVKILCIHGNHEERPWNVEGYKEVDWMGGRVFVQQAFPNILFARDGSVFEFGDTKWLVAGGAYSVDKYWRLITGNHWFPEEQPSDEIKEDVESMLIRHNNEMDYILSHTAPLKYEPVEVFLAGIDQSEVDKSTERWLDGIESTIDYKHWFCGHYHTDKKIDKMRFFYRDIDLILEKEGELRSISREEIAAAFNAKR